MAKKQATAPAECLKMNIELADNGIIIRNPENEDEVTIALEKSEPRAIGQKIFNWLETVAHDHKNDFIITNFDIDITATFKGREFK